MSNGPIELKVLEAHEERLIGLMKGSIDRIKLQLHAEGMLTDLNIDEKFAVLSTMNRMQKVLEFVLTQMMKESEKKSKEIFDHFLETLDEELAWENLKKDLGKSLSKVAEEWKKKSKQGKPWVEVFRKNMLKMVELLRTSVVRFPGLLASHGINLDDATRDLATSPIPDTNVTAKVFALVKEKVKDDPEEGFEKFIECLQDVDDFYFENVIKKLENDLEQRKKELEAAKKAVGSSKKAVGSSKKAVRSGRGRQVYKGCR